MKKLWLIFLLILTSIAWSGCGHHKETMVNTAQRTFVDDGGTTVLIPNHPQRILTLTSGYDTILLGMVNPERFVAVSFLTKQPGYSLEYDNARKVKKSIVTYSLERIVKLNPDLVIAADHTAKEVVEGVRGMGIPIVVIRNSRTVADTLHLIERLADAVNEKEKGNSLLSSIKKDLALMEEKKKLISPEEQKSVLFLSSMAGYAGVGSLFDDMCRYMGILNAPREAGLPERTDFTEERIVAMNPDFIFIPAYRDEDEAWRQRYAYNPALASTTAVKQNQVQSLKAAYLYTSNHYIGEAMLSIMKAVYPHIFTENDKK